MIKIGGLVHQALNHGKLQLVHFFLIQHFTASYEEIEIHVFLLAVRPKLFQFRSKLMRVRSLLDGKAARTHFVA